LPNGTVQQSEDGSKILWQLLASRSRTSTPQAVPEGKDMNRIYQGKVTAVEIPDGKDEKGKTLDLDVLWRHHELFQDAVNLFN
jgi:hypothetical protein